MPRSKKFQFRRGTAAQWASANPVLGDGEPGFERDTRVLKIGDGVTAWNSLAASQSGLESIGAAINQAGAVTTWNRWLALIRAVGTGAPPHASIIYSGGDVTDMRFDGTNYTWSFADYFSNLTVNTTTDTYTSNPVGPIRNGVILDSGAAFTQQLGAGGYWLNAVTSGGFPAGSLWWPLTITAHNVAVNSWVMCWFNNGTITADDPYGENLDTHLVETSFGAYNAHVVCGFTDKKFFAECARLSGTTTYILGGEFHPAFDNKAVGQLAYAQGTLDQVRGQQDMTHRLARVVGLGNIGTIGSWEFWTGSGWSATRANAVELTDTNGHVINGAMGFSEVRPGYWLAAADQMVDTHVNVYGFVGAAPTGPWRPVARVPLNNPPVGRTLPDGGFVIGWHTKVLDSLAAAPAEHSIVMLTSFAILPSGILGQNIRRLAPMFVVVPWF